MSGDPNGELTGELTRAGRTEGTDTSDTSDSGAGAKKRLAKHIVYYTLARLALFVALTAVIEGIGMAAVDQFPLLLAAVLALVISLPLSMVLFKSLRLQVNQDISAVDATRRAHREALEAQLRGESDGR